MIYSGGIYDRGLSANYSGPLNFWEPVVRAVDKLEGPMYTASNSSNSARIISNNFPFRGDNPAIPAVPGKSQKPSYFGLSENSTLLSAMVANHETPSRSWSLFVAPDGPFSSDENANFAIGGYYDELAVFPFKNIPISKSENCSLKVQITGLEWLGQTVLNSSTGGDPFEACISPQSWNMEFPDGIWDGIVGILETLVANNKLPLDSYELNSVDFQGTYFDNRPSVFTPGISIRETTLENLIRCESYVSQRQRAHAICD
ncbi:hypothetical protein ABW19_dt0206556 [Dactylella cylindrospora]|nr:hypothetical protein ABW19_dt0206556 [Dactylella cylindrospora]